jgi:hypothetical protein
MGITGFSRLRCPVIRAWAHYYWHLRHTNKKQPLRNQVRIEFIKVKQIDDDFKPVVKPDGPNLNCTGTVDLVVDDDTVYGITSPLVMVRAVPARSAIS